MSEEPMAVTGCSFCKRTRAQVSLLVESDENRGVRICDSCLMDALAVIFKEARRHEHDPDAPPLPEGSCTQP